MDTTLKRYASQKGEEVMRVPNLYAKEWLLLRADFFKEVLGSSDRIFSPGCIVDAIQEAESYTRIPYGTTTYYYFAIEDFVPVWSDSKPPATGKMETKSIDLQHYRWPLMNLDLWYGLTDQKEFVYWYSHKEDEDEDIWRPWGISMMSTEMVFKFSDYIEKWEKRWSIRLKLFV
jgi:hypothetical protein